MAVKALSRKQDKSTRKLFAALKAVFPGLPDDINQVLYRYNTVSIRVLIVDERFKGLSAGARHALVEDAITGLSSDIVDDITMLVMRTPEEMKKAASGNDLIYLEFYDPSRSDLN